MPKYHIADDGMPKVCTAQVGKCPVGGSGDHFDSKLEALQEASARAEEEYETFTSHSKKKSYHVNQEGNPDLCENEKTCKVMPFGLFKNVHSEDMSVIFGAAEAFRESHGRVEALKAAEEQAPAKAPKRTYANKNAKKPPYPRSSDGIKVGDVVEHDGAKWKWTLGGSLSCQTTQWKMTTDQATVTAQAPGTTTTTTTPVAAAYGQIPAAPIISTDVPPAYEGYVGERQVDADGNIWTFQELSGGCSTDRPYRTWVKVRDSHNQVFGTPNYSERRKHKKVYSTPPPTYRSYGC